MVFTAVATWTPDVVYLTNISWWGEQTHILLVGGGRLINWDWTCLRRQNHRVNDKLNPFGQRWPFREYDARHLCSYLQRWMVIKFLGRLQPPRRYIRTDGDGFKNRFDKLTAPVLATPRSLLVLIQFEFGLTLRLIEFQSFVLIRQLLYLMQSLSEFAPRTS